MGAVVCEGPFSGETFGKRFVGESVIVFISGVIVLFFTINVIVGFMSLCGNGTTSITNSVISLSTTCDGFGSTTGRVSTIFSPRSKGSGGTSQRRPIPTVGDVNSGSDSNSTSLARAPRSVTRLVQRRRTIVSSRAIGKGADRRDCANNKAMMARGGIRIRDGVPRSFCDLSVRQLLRRGTSLGVNSPSRPAILVCRDRSARDCALLSTNFCARTTSLGAGSASHGVVHINSSVYSILRTHNVNIIRSHRVRSRSCGTTCSSSHGAISRCLRGCPAVRVAVSIRHSDVACGGLAGIGPARRMGNGGTTGVVVVSNYRCNEIGGFPS